MKKFISKFAAISMAAGVLFAPCNIVRAAIPYDNETQKYDSGIPEDYEDDFIVHENKIQGHVPNYAQLLETINRSTDDKKRHQARMQLFGQLLRINTKIEAIDILMEILKYSASKYSETLKLCIGDIIFKKLVYGFNYEKSYFLWSRNNRIVLYLAHTKGNRGIEGEKPLAPTKYEL